MKFGYIPKKTESPYKKAKTPFMKIAALQYQYDFPANFDHYQQKITQLVTKLAKQGVEILLFPEYAGFEMASFAPLERLSEWIPSYLDLFQKLSTQYEMFICSGSQIIRMT